MYEKEEQLGQLFRFFSTVSLMLCSMGLFALFSLHVLQKTKEMSIRKVLGANYLNLIKTITRNYSTITILSIGVAIPIAWYCVTMWLAEFSYNVQVGFGIYFFSGFVILLTSFIVIAYHIFKILNINPVDTLKNE
jgi:putative ABC transport system permease protein